MSEEDLIVSCMLARATAHPAGWPLLTLSKVSVVSTDRLA
jgi:hypothetical protein